MKVTQGLHAYLVNSNNLVKIGNQILQYNYDNIKVIGNGDENQIANLATTKSTQGTFIVVNGSYSIANSSSPTHTREDYFFHYNFLFK